MTTTVVVSPRALPASAALSDLSNVAEEFVAIFGGTSSSYPALKRSGSALQVRMADDSGYSAIYAGDYVLNGANVIATGGTGVICLQNITQDDFARLQFGGVTTAFPSIKRSGATIQVRLADDSAYAPVTASYVRTAPVTVSGLPAAATAGSGARAFVTDATATTFNSVVAGSGANGVPVFSDGTNWRIG